MACLLLLDYRHVENMATGFSIHLKQFLTLLSRVLMITSLLACIHVSATVNYVVPNNVTVACSHNTSCLTFNENVNSQENHFNSSSLFVFLPGRHELNTNLTLHGVHNMTLTGKITDKTVMSFFGTVSVSKSVEIILKPHVSLSWENCKNIEINSLLFFLSGSADFRMNIVNTLNIFLHNISMRGSESNSQCSAIGDSKV